MRSIDPDVGSFDPASMGSIDPDLGSCDPASMRSIDPVLGSIENPGLGSGINAATTNKSTDLAVLN